MKKNILRIRLHEIFEMLISEPSIYNSNETEPIAFDGGIFWIVEGENTINLKIIEENGNGLSFIADMHGGDIISIRHEINDKCLAVYDYPKLVDLIAKIKMVVRSLRWFSLSKEQKLLEIVASYGGEIEGDPSNWIITKRTPDILVVQNIVTGEKRTFSLLSPFFGKEPPVILKILKP